MMNQTNDAARFNTSAKRDSTDNWDFTAWRITKSAPRDIEFGLARRCARPICERYSWSTANMWRSRTTLLATVTAISGNPTSSQKKPTLSATFDWHDAERRRELKLTRITAM